MKCLLSALAVFAVIALIDVLVVGVRAIGEWFHGRRAEKAGGSVASPSPQPVSAAVSAASAPTAAAVSVRGDPVRIVTRAEPRTSRRVLVDERAEALERMSAAVLAQVVGDPEAGGERLWEEAQRMPHSAKPDPAKDREYLKTLAVAAQLGHFGAIDALSRAAFARGRIVEAYYWCLLAELKGSKTVAGELRRLRAVWISKGCPEEHSNTHQDFSREQGSFTRAVLRLRSAKAYNRSCKRLKALADSGLAEARLFMERNKIRAMVSDGPVGRMRH